MTTAPTSVCCSGTRTATRLLEVTGRSALGTWAVESGRVPATPNGTTDVVIDVPSGRVIAAAGVIVGDRERWVQQKANFGEKFSAAEEIGSVVHVSAIGGTTTCTLCGPG